jgi:hypothetical protein
VSHRGALPSRRNHVTQKVRIPGRTLYISVHDNPAPAELFLRVKGVGCTAETIALYDVIARLASIARQYGAPLEKIGELLLGAKFEPAGPVQDHPTTKNCTSLPDLIGRLLLVEYCARDDLAHVPSERKRVS